MNSIPNEKQNFIRYLELYKIEHINNNDETSFKLLDCAYDLFCALENLAQTHNSMKANILNILTTKGEMK